MQNYFTHTLFAALGFAALSLHTVSAQLPISRPGGIILKTIKGSNGYTLIGVPFTREPVARAVVSSVSGNVLTAFETPFSGTYGPESTTQPPHSVLIVTGANRGVTAKITANTTSTITFANASTLVGANDEVLVVPDWTLGNLFGTGSNPSGLTSNALAASADIVYVANGSGSLNQYFHNGTNWRQTSSATNRNNLGVGGLNAGVLILKKSAGDLTFEVKGVLRSGKNVTSIPTGFSIVTYPDVAGTTLLGTGLQSILTGNSLSANADIVYIPNAAGTSLTQYYWNTANWRTTTSASNQNTFAIKPETAILINKKAGTATWSVSEAFVP